MKEELIFQIVSEVKKDPSFMKMVIDACIYGAVDVNKELYQKLIMSEKATYMLMNKGVTALHVNDQAAPYRHQLENLLEAKSFFKQSFIKYLQSEVERLGKEKEKNITKNELDDRNPMWNVNQSGYRQAISDQITHLQAQIKELESIKN